MTQGSRGSVVEVAGFVLAGGRSTRMGQDKALLELGSMKLIERARTILAGAGVDVWIAGARSPELAAFAPVIPDMWENAGPLGGVCSALRYTDREWAAFVTVDQPLMAPAMVSSLFERARESGSAVVVGSVGGEAQTFPAVVRRDALPVLESELRAGRRGCLSAFCVAGLQVVAAEEIAGAEAASLVERWFSNVNTPQDLASVKADLLRE